MQLPFNIITCALFLFLTAASAPTTQPLLHVPDEPSQAKAERMIREVFAKEYAIRLPASRIALAQKMFQQANDSPDDPAARFVLLREARDISAAAGDASTPQRAIRAMSQYYAVDSLRMLLAAMVAAHQSAATPQSQIAIAQTCLKYIDEAIVADDYSTATRLLNIAESAAGKARNVSLVNYSRERNKALQSIFLEYQSVEKSRGTLRDSPDEPAACARVGRFLCFYKSDWAAGLPLLAKGIDGPLHSLARDDLAATSNPARRLAIADSWWELAQNQPQAIHAHLQARAAFWYRQALADLNGIHRSIVQKRIETAELEALRDQNILPGLATELFKGNNFQQLVKTRIDDQLNFDWGDHAPDPALPKDNFALRWTGMLRPPAPGNYELVIIANTSAHIWLDEKSLLDNPNLSRHRNGVRLPVNLNNPIHSMRIDYWDSAGIARIKLLWRGPGMQKDELIPASAFFHDASAIPSMPEAP